MRARAGEEEGGEDDLAFGEFVMGVAIQLGRCLKQRLDLRGAVDVDRGRALLAQAPPFAFGGVLGDAEALVFDRDRECPLQVVDRPVDRPRRERPESLAVSVSLRLAPLDRPGAGLGLLHLEGPVLVNPLGLDLVESPIAEEGNEAPERPFFVLGRFYGDLPLASGRQTGSEGAKGWHLIDLAPAAGTARLPFRGRHPEAAVHVGEDVLQLFLSFAAIPTFVLVAERHVLALCIGAKAERVHAAGPPLAHEHPTLLAGAHG